MRLKLKLKQNPDHIIIYPLKVPKKGRKVIKDPRLLLFVSLYKGFESLICLLALAVIRQVV